MLFYLRNSGEDFSDISHMLLVNHTCERLNLSDVGGAGSGFTWSNNNAAQGNVQERINYALINDAWRSIWQHNTITLLPRHTSDHNAILLESGVHRFRRRRR